MPQKQQQVAHGYLFSYAAPDRANLSKINIDRWRPHQESNLDLILRRNLFYPLNYRDTLSASHCSIAGEALHKNTPKMIDQQLIDYLREKTKGKLLMSPEQLAEEIGIPAKQQSKLRKEGRFPIPFKNIGRLVYYSIYDVADFLLNAETAPAKEVPAEPTTATPLPKKKPAKATAPVQDLSHIFMLRAFAQSLEDRATTMLSLAENLRDYANKKEMMDIFQKKFPAKN